MTLAFLAVLVRTAWVCDDAFITFRTVDNFVNGYGLRWNVSERVQSYTHPLWLFVFAAAYSVTREPYYTSFCLTAGLTLLAFFGYGVWVPRQPGMVVVGGLLLLSSRAFVDFSTSGLENALSHFLLAIFVAAWFQRQSSPRWRVVLFLAGGLALLNRHDLVLLVLPGLVAASLETGLRTALPLWFVGFLPLLGWELFSLTYYGFLVPNTAFAKLNTGIAPADLIRQGLHYYLDSLHRDPLTVPTIVTGALVGLASRADPARPLALGMMLYCVYVIGIGGDFMSGRFLSVPMLVGVSILTRPRWPVWPVTAPLTVTAVLFTACLGSDLPAFATGREFGVNAPLQAMVDTSTGIADERRVYFPEAGLLRMVGGSDPVPDRRSTALALRQQAPKPVVLSNIGFVGFYAGPTVHIIDCLALSDPLLAQLPAHPHWRIGHFTRQIPAGYVATRATGRITLADAELAAFYRELADIVAGPLWNLARFKKILKMNTGGYGHLLNGHTVEPSGCDASIEIHRFYLWNNAVSR